MDVIAVPPAGHLHQDPSAAALELPSEEYILVIKKKRGRKKNLENRCLIVAHSTIIPNIAANEHHFPHVLVPKIPVPARTACLTREYAMPIHVCIPAENRVKVRQARKNQKQIWTAPTVNRRAQVSVTLQPLFRPSLQSRRTTFHALRDPPLQPSLDLPRS